MRFREFIIAPEGESPWLVDVLVPGSKEGTWYRVRQHITGRWTCNCKGFSYRQQDCKHIVQVQKAGQFTEAMVEALV